MNAPKALRESPILKMSQSLEDTLLGLLADLKPGASLNPNDIAKAAHTDTDRPDAWRRDLHRIKAIAVGLARQGKIEILRKGKPVNPDNLKGIYRLRLASAVNEAENP